MKLSEVATSIKSANAGATQITIPRAVVSGGIAERDFDGVQQYIPLIDITIDDE